jgi:hypothetical protein
MAQHMAKMDAKVEVQMSIYVDNQVDLALPS